MRVPMTVKEVDGAHQMAWSIVVESAQGEALADQRLTRERQGGIRVHHAGERIMPSGPEPTEPLRDGVGAATDLDHDINLVPWDR
jgi:hypothetical protein